MITKEQITALAKKHKINETTIFREYLQMLFLSKLYSFTKSREILFKGGTALHLIFKAPRFSEDLDFTVEQDEEDFLDFIWEVFKKIVAEETVEFKERKTITGKRFLLTANPSILTYKVFINLDFSFREKALDIKKSIIETEYPILFNSYIYHLSKEEIAAEKIRAILTRKKGRDLYDLWFLLTQNVHLDDNLIKQKLKYYHLENIKGADILKRIKSFPEKKFVLDMRPFVPLNERDKLVDFFTYLKEFLAKKLNK
ncbi:nucleotidyl transferase AbiEii/AbiGii toxin family protein [Patescibacteria group bacterium]|nr:nucleotidyl transferase AbiEii/AbiGii toxin family protein [Patescibacteria group bacterium]